MVSGYHVKHMTVLLGVFVADTPPEGTSWDGGEGNRPWEWTGVDPEG